MIRDDMIEEMEKFWKSIPQEASNYHVFDMLLSRMERLGMKPPYNSKGLTNYGIAMGDDVYTWEEKE